MSEQVEPFPITRTHPFDPPAALGQLRQRCPVTRVRVGAGTAWLVTGWAEVRAALADSRLSAAHTRAISPAAPPPAPPVEKPVEKPAAPPPAPSVEKPAAPLVEVPAPEPRLPAGLFIAMDRPDHAHYRRAVAPFFTAAGVRRFAPYIESLVASRIEAMVRAGAPADFVAAVAVPVPALVVGEVLGVPVADRAEFGLRSATLLTVNEPGMREYLRELVQRKRAEPGPDLVSHLVASEVNGAPLPDDEIATICAMILAAGHETVTGMLALGLFALLDDPARYQALHRDRSGLDAAVEELLRYLTVVQFGLVRVARDELVLAGQKVAAGDTVIASLTAANRDDRQFDGPDTLSWDRGAGHVAFGHGIHRCIGEHLARLQLTITFRALLDRLPDLRLAEPADHLPTSTDRAIYGVPRLPVTW